MATNMALCYLGVIKNIRDRITLQEEVVKTNEHTKPGVNGKSEW